MGTYTVTTRVRDMLAVVAVICRYYISIALPVRRQLRILHLRAQQIPDLELRRMALAKLADEHLNAQAASVFATLAPRRHRRTAARLAVTFEVMYDYLDSVSEQPANDPLANGLQLHAALLAAVVTPTVDVDFYAHHSQSGDDGGYLHDLAARCRSCLGQLPAFEQVLPVALAAVERCGIGQARTHAAPFDGIEQLRTWAAKLAPDAPQHEWWERAAGAASSLAVHALFVAAADPRTSRAEAVQIDRAYFPSICALSTLLDSLIDQGDDEVTGEHCYITYYKTPSEVAIRLEAIAREGAVSVLRLRRARRHAVITAGVAGFYLSATSARRGTAARATEKVLAAFSPVVMQPILSVLQYKRLR